METEFVDKSLEELIEEKRREQSGGGGKAPRGPAGPERGRGGEGVGRGRGGPRGDFPRQVPGAGPIHPYGHPRGGFPMMNPMMNPMMMGAFAGQGGGMFQPPPPSFPNRPGGGRNMGMGGGPPAHQQHPRGGQAPAGNNRDPIFIEAEKKIKTQKFQKCVRDEATGDVIVLYKNHEVVRVVASGEVHLQTAGQPRQYVFSTLNDALAPIGVRVVLKTEGAYDGDWYVSDGGKFMKAFADGMVLPTWMGGKVASRRDAIFAALNDEDRQLAVLAAAASAAQAMKHGLNVGIDSAIERKESGQRRQGGRGRGGYRPY